MTEPQEYALQARNVWHEPHDTYPATPYVMQVPEAMFYAKLVLLSRAGGWQQ